MGHLWRGGGLGLKGRVGLVWRGGRDRCRGEGGLGLEGRVG